jgi:hypothetical protein
MAQVMFSDMKEMNFMGGHSLKFFKGIIPRLSLTYISPQRNLLQKRRKRKM